MSDRLLDLQHAIKSYLEGKEYFSNSKAQSPVPIPVVTEDVGNLDSAINEALAQVQGISVLIRAPGGKIPSGDNAIPVYNPAYIHIRVYENPAMNRFAGGTWQPACKVGDAIVRLLFGQTMEGFSDPLIPKSRMGVADEDVPFYDIVLETVVALDAAEPTRDESLLAEDGTPLETEAGNTFTSEQ